MRLDERENLADRRASGTARRGTTGFSRHDADLWSFGAGVAPAIGRRGIMRQIPRRLVAFRGAWGAGYAGAGVITASWIAASTISEASQATLAIFRIQ